MATGSSLDYKKSLAGSGSFRMSLKNLYCIHKQSYSMAVALPNNKRILGLKAVPRPFPTKRRKSLKNSLRLTALLALCVTSAFGQGKLLTTDPLTNLPLIGATDSGNRIPGLAITYNQPTQMPSSQVCNSKFTGDFYSLFKIKVDAVVAWYSSHLTGFKKIDGYDSQRSQTAFYNSDRSIVIFITSKPGPQSENNDAYSVSYQRYQPGLSEKTITSLTQKHLVCQ